MQKTKNIALIGILGALSFIVMIFEIPFPLAPWLKFDLSDTIVLFGGLVGGPLMGIALAFVKIILYVLLKGSQTGGVGQIASILGALTFILPTIILYEKTKKIGIALFLGTISMTFFMIVTNYFYITPFYVRLYKMDFLIEMIDKKDNSFLKYICYYYGFFNIFKGILQSLVYLIVHKNLSSKYRVN
ncbi:MAG: ECF transporter S component [Fusobacteriaceae bacterium]